MIGQQGCFLGGAVGLCLVISMSFSRVEPVEAAWRFVPALTLSERYDDNIRFVEEDPEGDAVTTVTPRLSLSYEGKVMSLGAGYHATVERFARHSELNNEGHGASMDLGLDRLFGSRTTSLSLMDTFRFSPELSEFREAAEQQEAMQEPENQGIRVPRGDTWANAASLTLTRQSSARLTERLQYTHRLVRFEIPTLIDSNTHEGALEVTNQLDRTNSITTRYSYRYFDNREQEDAQSHGFTAGVGHLFSPTLSMTANMGLSYSIQPTAHSTGLVGGLGLSKTVEGFSLTANYSRNISLAGGLSGELVTTQTLSASLVYTVTQNLRASISGSVADNRSVTSDAVEITSWMAGASLTYRIRTWLSSEVRYRHYEQRSKGELGNDLTRNQYTLSLTATWP